MAHINLNRFKAVKKIAGTHRSIAWGKNAGALVFAGLLIACSLTVGCSIDRPKPVSSTTPTTQTPEPSTIASSTMPAPALPAAKPAPKKVVRKRPATVTYTDKTYGVSFEYPRKYGLETGEAANNLTDSNPIPMNFVQPGGIALAAVELPESSFPNTDYSYAFFNVSMNNTLTAETCGEFSVPQPAPKPAADATTQTNSTDAKSTEATSAPKLMLGDLEMQATETVSGEGTRQSDVKYFHVFQNGACYEFALNVTTNASEGAAGMKHVDRDKVFDRLEKILATVKINPVAAPTPEVTASSPASPAPDAPVVAQTPVQ